MSYAHLTLDELQDLSHIGDKEVVIELGRRFYSDHDSVLCTLVQEGIENSWERTYTHSCDDEELCL